MIGFTPDAAWAHARAALEGDGRVGGGSWTAFDDPASASSEPLTSDQYARRLLANLLLYHYRESKPQYCHWFAMQEMTPEALVDELEARRIGGREDALLRRLRRSRYQFQVAQ